jgi:predicted phage terminase large subunit-like protein
MGVKLKGQPGRQQLFLSSTADICVYGGAAGGGKSYALLLEPTYHYKVEGFAAVFFRRSYPQVTMPGGLWDESMGMYPLLGGVPRKGNLDWTFESGSTVTFRHMEYEKDKLRYQGSQICLLCFDQLEEFSEDQFFFMLSRNRSVCGVRPYVRATCNPNPDSFLRHFLSWWIADDGYADLSRQGKVRWFVRIGDRLVWADTRAELVAQYPPPDFEPKSVSFIPATVFDNPALLQANPSYLANLMALPPVDRERLLGDVQRGGNWDVRPSAGKVFNRAWFRTDITAVPAGGTECRYWDFAATEKEVGGPDPDFTASTKIRVVQGRWYVMDSTADQVGQAEADRMMKNLARQDLSERESQRLTRTLAGFDARGVPSRGDKLVRAAGLAAQAQAGNVLLVRARWNETWLNHMHNQPETPKKDIMDASSGAFNALVGFASERPDAEQSYMGSKWGESGRRRGESRWRRMR